MSLALASLAGPLAAPAAAQTLRGSRESVDLMYARALSRDLQFFRTAADIYQAARLGAFDLISETEDLELERATWPFVLANTKRFADSLAAEYHAGCGERLAVTSGARPIDKQPRNASPKSVHPTGMAVDFRRPRNPACLTWLRKSLVSLEGSGVIEATEERHPPHFHVAVLNQTAPRVRVAAGTVAPSLTDSTHKPTVKGVRAKKAGKRRAPPRTRKHTTPTASKKSAAER